LRPPALARPPHPVDRLQDVRFYRNSRGRRAQDAFPASDRAPLFILPPPSLFLRSSTFCFVGRASGSFRGSSKREWGARLDHSRTSHLLCLVLNTDFSVKQRRPGEWRKLETAAFVPTTAAPLPFGEAKKRMPLGPRKQQSTHPALFLSFLQLISSNAQVSLSRTAFCSRISTAPFEAAS
jgi:hypothetical protein